jgi:hypothetical protein
MFVIKKLDIVGIKGAIGSGAERKADMSRAKDVRGA